MKYLLFIGLLIPALSFAENVSSVSTRYENLDFDNSVQKICGDRLGIRFDIKKKRIQRLSNYPLNLI